MTFFFQDMFNAILAHVSYISISELLFEKKRMETFSILPFFSFKKMTLKEGTPAYQEWKHMKEPANLKMYMWHVMNPDEIVNEKAKPYLKEMGPYVFK